MEVILILAVTKLLLPLPHSNCSIEKYVLPPPQIVFSKNDHPLYMILFLDI